MVFAELSSRHLLSRNVEYKPQITCSSSRASNSQNNLLEQSFALVVSSSSLSSLAIFASKKMSPISTPQPPLIFLIASSTHPSRDTTLSNTANTTHPSVRTFTHFLCLAVIHQLPAAVHAGGSPPNKNQHTKRAHTRLGYCDGRAAPSVRWLLSRVEAIGQSGGCWFMGYGGYGGEGVGSGKMMDWGSARRRGVFFASRELEVEGAGG